MDGSPSTFVSSGARSHKAAPKLKPGLRWLIRIAVVAAVAAAAYAAWEQLKPKGLPAGFASGNGRIEAVEIDVAAKTGGRIREVLADEGDFVRAGQVLARMDTTTLEAQRREAEAQLQKASSAVETARTAVAQAEAQKAAALAVVTQRQAELQAADRQLARTEVLAAQGYQSQQTLDNDRTSAQAARATVTAVIAQARAADVATAAARSQVRGAETAVRAAQAVIDTIQTEIDDSVLRSPRDGRVQYRVAEPGEVLGGGGRVLNLVDLNNVYMTFFLPTEAAGKVALGTEVRLVLDAAPQYVIPARVSFVADVAQFTPKTVETAQERQKLMFRVKARIPPDLLRANITQVKTGLPGMAYVRLDPRAEWPAKLQIRTPR